MHSTTFVCRLLQLHRKRLQPVTTNKPAVSQDDVSIPDFSDGILSDLIRCKRNPRVDELVDLVDDACFRFFFRQRGG